MKDLIAVALRHEKGVLRILDQRQLPKQEVWIPCHTAQSLRDSIRTLQIRGAPLIGVAAALLLALMIEQEATEQELSTAAALLKQARPTAINLMYGVDRVMRVLEKSGKAAAITMAEEIFLEDVNLCERLATYGAELISDHQTVMTHCNSGSLATVGIGTAFGVIKKAQQQGKHPHVYVNETRPLLQGGRLTTWECEKARVSYTLICDDMAGYVMSLGKIHRIFVGADRIAMNGDVANKIGTYTLAVLAQYHHIPFYVAAPYTTLDSACRSGRDIPIEQRHPDEVRGMTGAVGKLQWSPANSPVYNPSFDITPVGLVSGYILDKGFFTREQVMAGCLADL